MDAACDMAAVRDRAGRVAGHPAATHAAAVSVTSVAVLRRTAGAGVRCGPLHVDQGQMDAELLTDVVHAIRGYLAVEHAHGRHDTAHRQFDVDVAAIGTPARPPDTRLRTGSCRGEALRREHARGNTAERTNPPGSAAMATVAQSPSPYGPSSRVSASLSSRPPSSPHRQGRISLAPHHRVDRHGVGVHGKAMSTPERSPVAAR